MARQKLGVGVFVFLELANTLFSVVPVAGTIKDGETVKIECVDW